MVEEVKRLERIPGEFKLKILYDIQVFYPISIENGIDLLVIDSVENTSSNIILIFFL